MNKRPAIFLVFALCFLPVLTGSARADDTWDKRKDKDGIVVFTREVEGSQLKEFRVSATYPHTVTQVVDALRNVDAYPEWMPMLHHARLVSHTTDVQYIYMENAAPWPVSNRDAVYQYTYHLTDNGSQALVELTLANHLVPEKKGIVRMAKGEGTWTIKAVPEGTWVENRMHADPGGKIPNFLVNIGSVKAPFDTLKGLRNYLQSLQGD